MAAAYCYLLYTDEGQTYVGATVDPDRRLRQHNQEIKGGAHATAMRVAQGLVWKRACLVPLPDWKSALQFEWRWKQISRVRYHTIRPPLRKRLISLQYLLSLERSTTAAIPYAMYPDGLPCPRWDSEEARQIWEGI